MDAYPEDYINHNLPLVLLSGLEADSNEEKEPTTSYPLLAERGPKIFSDFPPLSGTVAEELRNVLLEEDGTQKPWRSAVNAPGTMIQIGYKIKSTGRVGFCAEIPPKMHLAYLSFLVISTTSTESSPSAAVTTNKPHARCRHQASSFKPTICSPLSDISPIPRIAHLP